MAEGALFELAGNVLKLLGSLIVSEVKLAISAKTEIKRLEETVSLIQPLIRALEKQSSHSHQNEDWLRKYEVVLNEAEKLLDDFSTEVDAEVCNFSCSSNPLTYGAKTAREIKAIRKRLNDIAKEAESSQSSVEPRITVAPHSIGEFNHLRHLCLSEIEHFAVLPNSITKLLYLQTLELNSCKSLKELPQGLKMLVNLIQLHIRDCDKLTHMPLGLGHLTSLEILTRFVVRQEGSMASLGCWYKKKQAKSGAGLSELKELSKLRGSLVIGKLGHGEDDMVECKATNMKQKQHLQQLQLFWDEKWDGETECYDEMSLEGLQPHPNLGKLELHNYMGVRIPSWISSITNLVHFDLCYNKRLQHLPPLNQLPFLKVISLWKMEALEYISDEDSVSNVVGASSSSSSSKTPFFASLSSLKIRDCPKLKGWWRNSDDDNEPHHLLLPSFPPPLSELEISNCPNLTSMPTFPYLKESLYLSGCSWKVLEQTMKMKMGAATTSTYFPPLSQLQQLRLFDMNDFESLPEDGLSSLHWIGSLTSLQTLGIWRCPNLTSLPQEIRNLTSLKELTICGCPLLGQRCKRQIGEDWPFIAHVPTVLVDLRNQQEETISSESDLE